MGLNLVVGIMADIHDFDEDFAEEVREDFAAISELLNGKWTEPAAGKAEDFEMGSYSRLHTLRRLAVHFAVHGTLPEPVGEGLRASEDPLLEKVYATGPADPPAPFDHLVQHSDAGGYYVPVDFPAVLEDAPGGLLGSSVRLLAEARRLAEALGLPEDPELDPDEDTDEPWQHFRTEASVCLTLIAAAKRSIETGAAITFA